MLLTDIITNYLDATSRGEIPIVICSSCGKATTYPRATCTVCGSENISLKKSSGIGTLYAFTEIHRAPATSKIAVPYTIAIVQLDEGIKVKGVLGSTVGLSAKIGMRLKSSPPVAGHLTFVPA